MKLRILIILILIGIYFVLNTDTGNKLYRADLQSQALNMNVIDNSGKNRPWPDNEYGQPEGEYSYYAENEFNHTYTMYIKNNGNTWHHHMIPLSDTKAINTYTKRQMESFNRPFNPTFNWYINVTSPKYRKVDWTTKFIDPEAENGYYQAQAKITIKSNPGPWKQPDLIATCKDEGRIYVGTFLNEFVKNGDEHSFKWVLENTDIDPWVFDCSNRGLFYYIGVYGNPRMFEILINRSDFKPEYLQAPIVSQYGKNALDAFLVFEENKKFDWVNHLTMTKLELFKMAWKRGITSGTYVNRYNRCLKLNLEYSCKRAYRYAEFLCFNYKNHCNEQKVIAKHAKDNDIYDFSNWGPKERWQDGLIGGFPLGWAGERLKSDPIFVREGFYLTHDYITLIDTEPKSFLTDMRSYYYE